MTTPEEHDPERTRRRPAIATEPSHRDVDLRSVVVRYENRPDRCTVTPTDCTDAERTTTWLSADVDAFVDLAERR